MSKYEMLMITLRAHERLSEENVELVMYFTERLARGETPLEALENALKLDIE